MEVGEVLSRALVRIALVAAVAGIPLAVASGANAQVYPPGGCSVGTSVSLVQSGSQMTVTGTNFPAGPVNVLFDGQLVATATASSGFSATFTVPAAAPGLHTITAVAGDGSCSASTQIQVQVGSDRGGTTPVPGSGGPATAGSGGGGALAFTGAEWVRFLVLLALLLLTVGVALQRGARRRAEVQRQVTR